MKHMLTVLGAAGLLIGGILLAYRLARAVDVNMNPAPCHALVDINPRAGLALTWNMCDAKFRYVPVPAPPIGAP